VGLFDILGSGELYSFQKERAMMNRRCFLNTVTGGVLSLVGIGMPAFGKDTSQTQFEIEVKENLKRIMRQYAFERNCSETHEYLRKDLQQYLDDLSYTTKKLQWAFVCISHRDNTPEVCNAGRLIVRVMVGYNSGPSVKVKAYTLQIGPDPEVQIDEA